ncbi:MAG: PaaI family thioesterase [Thermoanaerobaculia bacterium]
MEEHAFQDLIPDNYCFGCGPLNPDGLQIKSYWDGQESVCTFQPSSAHAAGPRQFLNGGITATVIDCHAVCTAIAWAYRSEARAVGSDPRIWFVTSSLEVQYLAPAPIEEPVHVRARVLEASPRKALLDCSLSSGGIPRASARVVAVRVPPSWRRGASG